MSWSSSLTSWCFRPSIKVKYTKLFGFFPPLKIQFSLHIMWCLAKGLKWSNKWDKSCSRWIKIIKPLTLSLRMCIEKGEEVFGSFLLRKNMWFLMWRSKGRKQEIMATVCPCGRQTNTWDFSSLSATTPLTLMSLCGGSCCFTFYPMYSCIPTSMVVTPTFFGFLLSLINTWLVFLRVFCSAVYFGVCTSADKEVFMPFRAQKASPALSSGYKVLIRLVLRWKQTSSHSENYHWYTDME